MWLEVVQFGHALQLPPPTFESMKVMGNYIKDHAEPMTSLTDMTNERRLTTPEQTLGLEMARCMSTLLLAVPLLTPGDESKPASAAFISKCVESLVDPVCINLFVAFILYEIQMDMGGGSRDMISREFVEQSYRKKGLKEQSSLFLVRLLMLCDEFRYEVLEQFNRADVFLSQTVRPCYMMELLYSVSFGKYMAKVEQNFLKHSRHAPVDHMAYFELVYALQPRSNTLGMMMLRVTTTKIYLLTPSQDGSANDEQSGQWDPSRELEKDNFTKPTIELERAASDIARIYRCYGSQLLAIEWRSPVDAVADVTVLAFQRMGIRDDVAHFLHRSSSESHDKRAAMLSDPKIRAEVSEKATSDVLAATIAMVAPQNVVATVFGGGKVASFPRMYLMTDKEVIVSDLNFKAWTVPDNAGTYFDDIDSFVPADVNIDHYPGLQEIQHGVAHTLAFHGTAAALTAAQGALPGTQAVVLATEKDKQKASRWKPSCSLPGFPQSKRPQKEQSDPVLQWSSTAYSLPPTEVEFDVGSQPDLRLKAGGGSLAIRFCDDSAREHWRRALAYVCCKGDSGFTREEK